MPLKEEINELFNMINNHSDDIEFLNFVIRMKNGTIFKYKMDKKKEFRIRLKENRRNGVRKNERNDPR
jgi:hypothetical protein